MSATRSSSLRRVWSVHVPWSYLLAASLVVLAAAIAPRAAGAEAAVQAAASGKSERVVIGLRRKQHKLSAFVRARATPGTETYRDYESVRSLARTYGAKRSTWRRVRRYLHRHGVRAKLDITRGFASARLSKRQRRRAWPPPRRLRKLVGPVLFTAGPRQRTRPTSDRDSDVPRAPGPGRTGTPAGCANGVGSGGLTPNQYRTAYGVDSLHARGLLGQGTRIAFVELAGFSQPALDRFARCFGFAAPRPTVHPVGLRRELAPDNEVQLDTQIAAAVAPMAEMDIFQSGASPGEFVRLFAAPLNAEMTGGEPPDVISSSLGFCESSFGRPATRLLEYVLSIAAGSGITVVNAAGDDGSSACFSPRLAVAYPASSRFVTAVGGTRLTLTGSNEIASEVVWNDSRFGSPSAGGGGVSRFIRQPVYQRPVAGGSGFRAVPDVAFHSSRFPGYAIRSGGEWISVEGTSAAAPLLAGGAALAAEAAADAGAAPPGLLTPLLYLGAGEPTPGLLRDVRRGNNDLFRVGCCSAAPGYDRASGWGSLDLEVLTEVVVAAGR